jgi:hypothetical protein
MEGIILIHTGMNFSIARRAYLLQPQIAWINTDVLPRITKNSVICGIIQN